MWNHLPHPSHRLAPAEIFTATRFPLYDHLKHAHVFGCPTFVLEPALQDHKKLPKWYPHSCCGIFLSYSPEHSSSVGLVLNPNSGHVSPQYHLVYDDTFSTVPNAEGGVGFELELFNQETWNRLIASGHDRHLPPSDDPLPTLADE